MIELIKEWDGKMVVTQYDRQSRSWIFIAIHSNILGPATGGTRMMSYDSPEDGLADCLKLAKGMTMKFAIAGFPRGGGKAVIVVPPDLTLDMRTDLLLRYGRSIQQLNGTFFTGPDMGTIPEDMDIISKTGSPYVYCRSVQYGGTGSSGNFTAYGIFWAIKGTIEYLYGNDSLSKKIILVQGAGSVGRSLIELLLDEDATVVYTDINEGVRTSLPDHVNLKWIDMPEVYNYPCDVFSPCAAGGILNHETVEILACRAIVGAANNQLTEPAIATRIKERNILYAPDFAVNWGGAVGITGMEALNWTLEKAKSELKKLKLLVRNIYTRQTAENASSVDVAEKLANDNLKKAAC